MALARFVVNPAFEPELLRGPFGIALIAEATTAVEAAAKRLVPVRLGFLRDSITSVTGPGPTGGLIGRVVAKDFKAHWYEFGSRRTPAIHYLAGGLAAALPGAPIVGGGGRA